VLSVDTVISTLIGIVVGGVITYFVSKYYYRQSTKDLEIIARELGQQNQIFKNNIIALAAYESNIHGERGTKIYSDENGELHTDVIIGAPPMEAAFHDCHVNVISDNDIDNSES